MTDSCSLNPTGTRFATEFPCPRGYYNPDPMSQSLDSCLPCPPGHYCGQEGLTAPSGTCDPGERGVALGTGLWGGDAVTAFTTALPACVLGSLQASRRTEHISAAQVAPRMSLAARSCLCLLSLLRQLS